MAITSAIGDIIASIGELISTLFTTLYNLVHAIFAGITGFITSFLNLILGTIGSVFNVAGETAKFLLGKSNSSTILQTVLTRHVGNAVLIALVGAGFFVWLRYMNSQGKPVVVGNKKLN